MSKRACEPPFWVGFWVVLCAFCAAAGWMLSALHELNRRGYAAAFILFALGLAVWGRRAAPAFEPGRFLGKGRRRFRRAFPLAFLLLAALAFVGGALYAPSNYDALAYRTPRVLHWFAEERWHWIHTIFNRINTRPPGFEWVTAPLILFTKTDRAVFLINTFCFLALPGLIFSVFRRLGVRPRVAWHWMWLAPAGYCYLLQAGSVGNDLFGTVLALAAVDLALRARAHQSWGCVALSILAASLMTGAKASNLPLLLPWAVALAPCWRLATTRLAATAAVGIVAVLTSVVPSALLNTKACGDWSGQKAEGIDMARGAPLLRFANNIVLLTTQNLVPPVFPLAKTWNAKAPKLIPESIHQRLEERFENQGANLKLGEMAMEENSGLGFGTTLLVLFSGLAGWVTCRSAKAVGGDSLPLSGHQKAVLLSSAIALLVFMCKSGIATAARIVTPYYPLVMPLLLVGASQARVARSRGWRLAAAAVFALAALLVILSPARPLWPADAVLARLDARSHRLIARAKEVYAVYGRRSDGFAPAREILPPGTRLIGMVTFDDPEASLWRPFGGLRVEHLTPADSRADIAARGIQYALVSSERYGQFFKMDFKDWLAKTGAEVVRTIPLTLRAAKGQVDWHLVKFTPPPRQEPSLNPMP